MSFSMKKYYVISTVCAAIVSVCFIVVFFINIMNNFRFMSQLVPCFACMAIMWLNFIFVRIQVKRSRHHDFENEEAKEAKK